jgi:lysophospholipase L1-like esterase
VSNDEYFIDTLHFNAAGHSVMAEQLAPQLVSLGIL